MRETTVLVLACLAIPALALAAFLPSPGGSTSETQPSGGPMLPGLRGHGDQLATVTITGADGKLTLTRTPVAGKLAEGWTLQDKGGYPVPAATIRPVLDALLQLHGVAAKTDQPKLYGRLDLADPGHGSLSHLVALTDAKNVSLGQIVLGKQKEATGVGSTAGIYARVPGNATTWLAEPAVTLPDTTLDWIDHVITDIDAAQVKEVVVNQPGAAPLDFARDKPSDTLAIRDLPKTTKLKSETPGSDIQNAFHDLELQDVKPAAQAGGSQAGNVQLITFDGTTADFTLTKDSGQTWMTVTATGAKPADAIARKTKGWAYELPPDRATTLTPKLSDLVQAPAAGAATK